MASASSSPEPRHDTGREREFEALAEGYARAAERSGDVHVRNIRVAGSAIRIEAVGELLSAKLGTALAHLENDVSTKPDLTIRAWDSATTGTRLPDGVGDLEMHALRGLSPAEGSQRVHTAYLRGDSGLSMLDLDGGCAVYWVPDAKTIPGWDISSPFRPILHWWTAEKGQRYVHAASVGTEHGGVLAVGKGGSGKSTTALASLRAGMLYAGDDYCVLDGRDEPRAHSLYGTARLKPDNVSRFQSLVDQATDSVLDIHEKLTVFLAPAFSPQLVQSLPIRAILLPRVGASATTLETVSGAQALAMLAPSTLLQLPAAAPGALSDMVRLIEKVPCYRLNMGPDEREVPTVIAELLAKLHCDGAGP